MSLRLRLDFVRMIWRLHHWFKVPEKVRFSDWPDLSVLGEKSELISVIENPLSGMRGYDHSLAQFFGCVDNIVKVVNIRVLVRMSERLVEK